MGLIEDITGGIQNGINSILTAGENALASISKEAVVLGGAGVSAAAIGTGIIVGRKSSKKSSKKKSTKKRKKTGRSRDWKYKSKQKHEVAYRKRRKKLGKKSYQKSYKLKKKSSSRRGVKYTKNGQPYILLKNGKARFIKKRSKK